MPETAPCGQENVKMSKEARLEAGSGQDAALLTMSSLSSCVVCHEEMRSARLLPCLHSACVLCLQMLADKSQVSHVIVCPACRHHCNVPKDGVRRFPRNLLAGQLADFVSNGGHCEDSGAAILTSSCESAIPAPPRDRGDKECVDAEDGGRHLDVNTFCVDCVRYLCDGCSGRHKKRRSMRDHGLIPVESMSPRLLQLANEVNDPPTCPVHPSESMSVYCVTCMTPVCRTCFSIRHKGHHCQELLSTAEVQKANLETAAEVLSSIAIRINEATAELEQRRQRSKDELLLSKNEINTAADKMCAMIRHRQKTLLEEVRDIEQLTEEKFRTSRRDMESYADRVSTLQRYLSLVLTDRGLYNTSVHAPGVQHQLRMLRRNPVQTVNWRTDLVPQPGFFSDRHHVLGSMCLQNETKPFEDEDEGAKLQLIGSVRLAGAGKVTGLISVHGHLAVTHRHDPHIYLYSSQETLVSRLLVEGLLNPRGMESDPHVSGRCVIIDEDSLLLHWITIGHSLTIGKHHTRCLQYVPLGVSVGHLGDVIMTGHPGHIVEIYSSKGEQMRELRLMASPANGQELMAVREGSGFVILDHISKQVTTVNASGMIQHVYGHSSQEEALSAPCHLALHPLGYLLVVDRDNGCIHLLDRNRRFLRHLLTARDGLLKPDRVLWDPNASLVYVAQTGEDGKQVAKVFKSLPDSVSQLTMELQLFEMTSHFKW